jgi:hypothetical protein
MESRRPDRVTDGDQKDPLPTPTPPTKQTTNRAQLENKGHLQGRRRGAGKQELGLSQTCREAGSDTEENRSGMRKCSENSVLPINQVDVWS